MNKVYKHLSNYEKFYGFEKIDAVVLSGISVIMFFLFEWALFGIVATVSYLIFCMTFKRDKPMSYLQSYLSYHIKPKIFKPGGPL